MSKNISFTDALGQSSVGKRHLLLGNGFSRACREDIFSYEALLDQADFNKLSKNARKAFDILKSTDFEIVMDALQKTSKLLKLYKGSSEIIRSIENDAKGLREVLVTAIAQNHPARPSEILRKEYQACKLFLGNFQNGRIYTLNYDLLLYWALMQDDISPDLTHDDGFRTAEEDEEEEGNENDYVTWIDEKRYDQNIFYLHGALHIFDAGAELKKYTWIRTGIPLIDQIRNALENEMFPLIVSEGKSEEKLSKIRHSDYLSRGLKSLSEIRDSLFIFGHSLAKNDNHILKVIERGRIQHLYIGLYGNSDDPSNKRIISRAKLMQDYRKSKQRSMEVSFYDASSAHVWG